MKDDLVATARGDDLPVAPPQRPLGPPAILEQPRLAHGIDVATVDDLGRWAAFLSSGADDVLSRDTLDEMARPEIIADVEGWTKAWGLGLELTRSGERLLAGHSGGMPGFSAGLAVLRPDGIGAVVLVN